MWQNVSIGEIMFDKLLNAGRFILKALLVLTIVGSGHLIHQSFMRHYIGKNSVMLYGPEGGGGSGFFVKAPSGKKYILTNRHVCGLHKNGYMEVYLKDQIRLMRKKIAHVYKDHDLCLIEAPIGPSGLNIATFNPFAGIIAIIGHPKLRPLIVATGQHIGFKTIELITAINVKPDQCDGRIIDLDKKSIKNQIIPDTVYLKDVTSPQPNMFTLRNICLKSYYSSALHAYSRGGSSGSPVVNFFGQVVAVLFAGHRGDQFESYAVPLADIKEFLKNK